MCPGNKKNCLTRILPLLCAFTLVFLCSCQSNRTVAGQKKIPDPIAWSGTSTVWIGNGRLRGSYDRLGTYAWKGIRYAQPPLGERRWRPPAPPEPWTGLKYATDFREMPVQRIPIVGDVVGSEDCLFLNVWRPATRETGLPVHVWIHGGDNLVGSADINPDFHGHAIAARTNAVSVSLNFRLGPLGWFMHPELKTGEPEGDSGNYGLLDILAGLRWIQSNIAAFGGDPENVTLSGESSGAINILYLMVSPLSKGLFHKAIVQSPYTSGTTREEAERFGAALARRLLPGQSESQIDAARLRGLNPRDLVSVDPARKIGIATFPFPILDGFVVPSEGLAAFTAHGRTEPIPLIIGSTKEETKVFQWFDKQNPSSPDYQLSARRESARWKSENVDALTDAIVRFDPGRKVYVYRFDWGAPDDQGRSVLGGRAGMTIGASHGLDMSFFMLTDTVYGSIFPFRLFTKANEKGRNELKDRMARYISNFIRSGDPESSSPKETIQLAGYSPERNGTAWQPWKVDGIDSGFLVLDADLHTARIRIER